MNNKIDEGQQPETQYAVRPHHRMARAPKDKYFKTRNVLNTLFIIGALAGLIVYFCASHNAGIIVILVAMVFKIVECCFRLIHR